MQRGVEEELREALGVATSVELLEHGAIPRSEGKAKRIVDLSSLR